METASHSLRPFRPTLPFHKPTCRRSPDLIARYKPSQGAGDHRRFDSRMVDENMIVLRMRIREMRMAETNHEAPGHWMIWEKQRYETYDADVCEAVGVLQRFLLSSRPSVALGAMVMVGLSVPTAAILVLSNLVQVGNGIVTAIVHH